MNEEKNSKENSLNNNQQELLKDVSVGQNLTTGNITQNIYNNSQGSNAPRLKQFQAPPTPEYYVDRPEISRDLKKRLLINSKTLVISAIHGLGSVGKSTLAAALAHDLDIKKHFADGVLWSTLGQEPDILSLLAGWVQGLGDYNYPATSIEATSAHLNTLLFDKAVLLVVDDAWIDENKGWEPIQSFKVGGDRCRMLVTTRDASIGNFLGATTYSLDVMTETQSLELLTKKIENQRRKLQKWEIKLAQVLAKAVGYLPLALELAAAQVASGTTWQVLIADIQQEIARLRSLKDPGVRKISDEEKFKKLSLQASLNLSIKRLQKSDRKCFAWLGVLPDDASITPKMTATLWDMDEREAEETLQYLRSQALILPSVFLADGIRTYRLHDLFHDLARNLLTAPQKPKRQGDLIGLGIEWKDVHSQFLDKYQQQTENNFWHTLSDDGYIHQHLVWHLEKAGKIKEIHQLLQEESTSGNNGWYEIRERLGQTAGFLTDVARAWSLAEVDWETKNPSQIVGLQCRYALLIASLNSLSANIPQKLLSVLVKNKFWNSEQGVAFALQKQNFKDRTNSLIALLDYLPENLKQTALLAIMKTARQIKSEYNCAYILNSLVGRLPEILYTQAIDIARQIQDEVYLTYALFCIIKELPNNLGKKVLVIIGKVQSESNKTFLLSLLIEKQIEGLNKEILNIVYQIKHEDCRFYLTYCLINYYNYCLSTTTISKNYNKIIGIIHRFKSKKYQIFLLESLNESESDNYNITYIDSLDIYILLDYFSCDSFLCLLIEKLQSENLYNEAIEEIVPQIQCRDNRKDILLTLYEELQSENSFEDGLETALQMKKEDKSTYVFSSLADKLPENLYGKAKESALDMQYEDYQAKVISSLIEEFQSKKFCHKALERLNQIQNEDYRAAILLSITDELPKNLYNNVLEIARQIQNKNYRLNITSILADKLRSNSLYNELLQIARQIQDEDSHADILLLLAEKLQSANLFRKLLEKTCQIKEEEHREDILLLLAEKSPKHFCDEILEKIDRIEDEYKLIDIYLFLAEKLQSDNLFCEVLETVRRIQDNEEFIDVEVLLSVVKKLPKHLCEEVLEIAYRIQAYDEQALVFTTLAEKLQSDNLFHEALESTGKIESKNKFVDVLLSLAKKLPEYLCDQVLEIARRIQNHERKAQVLITLAAKLQSDNLFHEVLEAINLVDQVQDTGEYARIKLILAEKLQSDNLFQEALETARQIQNEEERFNVLLTLAEKLQSGNLFHEALETARQIQDEEERFNALLTLAEKLQSDNLFHEVLETISQLNNEYLRVNFLSSLVQKLPDNLLPEVLKMAYEIQNEYFRVDFLSSLIPKLPDNLLLEVSEMVCNIQNESDSVRLVSFLLYETLSKKSKNEIFCIWLEYLKNTLSKLRRKDLLENLGILIPVIYKLGGNEALEEVAVAIEDVGKWWS